jgi:glycine cleavage system H protein
VAGEIVGINDTLAATPDQINGTPYESWLFKIKPAAGASTDRLIDAATYGKSIGE